MILLSPVNRRTIIIIQVKLSTMPIDPNRTFIPLNIALATISDSRTAENDDSGDILSERLQKDGHHLAERVIIKDDLDKIEAWFRTHIANKHTDVIITTGGTGLTGRDSTPEAVMRVADKEIPGFGEYFRWISAEKIGTSTIQSRAMAAVAEGTYIFILPGSPGACKDGWDQILHFQLDHRFRPCNFVELVPRLRET